MRLPPSAAAPAAPLKALKALPTAAIGLALAGVSAFLLSGCSEPSLASSEVGNPPAKGAVVGALLDAGEAPAAGAEVRLYPVAHDPVRDSLKPRLKDWIDTADAVGAFSLSGVDTGLYNVQARHPKTGDMALLRGVRVLKDRIVTARGGILKPPGSIVLTLPDLPSTAATYVYVAGTGVYTRITKAGENPTITLHGVPAGMTPDILYRAAPESDDSLVAEEVEVMPGDTVPAQVNPEWAHRVRIFLNTSTTGADVDEDAEHFPVAIRLGRGGHPFDFSEAARDGRDIRFTDRSGGPHKFEIESWDSSGGSAVIWVCAGTVRKHDSTQFMRMFWGNPAAASLSQPAFTGTLGYVGIWHMQTAAGDRVPDAGPGDNPLLLSGQPLSLKEGLLGLAADLDGRNRLLATGKSFPMQNQITLSLWFNTTSDSGGKLVGFGAQPSMVDTSRDRHVWMDDTGRVHFGVFDQSAPTVPERYAVISAPGRWNDGRWHHMAATLSPSGMALYLDGRKVAEDTAITQGQNYASGSGYWRLGYDFDLYDWPHKPKALFFKGALDEARVAHKELSAARIRLEYESQRAGGRFLRFEPE